ncbi:MAG: alanine--tRNA ligase-related protein [Marinilabiliales bacterium]|nr:alanine--tRNA ligase-related protein [Marinilabiliales bacterium]
MEPCIYPVQQAIKRWRPRTASSKTCGYRYGLRTSVNGTPGKDLNYDTDIFQPIIQKISEVSGIPLWRKIPKADIAMRVMAEITFRAVHFSIADGQLPSNNKAGYVIRRILRRAIRYGYSFLHLHEPFIFRLVASLSDALGKQFPELESQNHSSKK